MNILGRVMTSVVTGGFVLLTGLSHAFAYESGDLMCQTADEDRDDGIDFICSTHEGVDIASGHVVGPTDNAEFRLQVTTGAGGEPCNGTVNCNVDTDSKSFYDLEPGGYYGHIPFPNVIYVNCYCR